MPHIGDTKQQENSRLLIFAHRCNAIHFLISREATWGVHGCLAFLITLLFWNQAEKFFFAAGFGKNCFVLAHKLFFTQSQVYLFKLWEHKTAPN